MGESFEIENIETSDENYVYPRGSGFATPALISKELTTQKDAL